MFIDLWKCSLLLLMQVLLLSAWHKAFPSVVSGAPASDHLRCSLKVHLARPDPRPCQKVVQGP